MQQKFPNKRCYLVIDEVDYEVFPQGDDLNFTWKLNENGFYEHQLSSDIILTNHFTDTKQWINDYDYIKPYEDDIFIDFRVDKLCSGSYTTYWTGYLDMLGDWNANDSTFKTKAKAKSGYNTLLENIEKQFDLLNLGLSVVQTTNGGNTYKFNYYFAQVMQAVIEDLLPTYDYESNFLDDATNPVTGIANTFDKLTISAKEDIISAPAAKVALKAIFTLEEIINFWRTINVFPYVDEANNKFKLEHRYFFENNLTYSPFSTVGIDLTTLEDGKYILNDNSYKYNTAKLYSKEILNYNEFGRLQFYDGVITYDLKILDDKIKKYNSGNFITDLSYIQNSPDNIDKEGFVILANETGLSVITEDIALNHVSKNFSLISYSCTTVITDEENPKIGITNITGSDFASISLTLDNLSSGDLSVGDLFTLEFECDANSYSVSPFYIYIGKTAVTALPINESTGQISNILSTVIDPTGYNSLNLDIQFTTSDQVYLNFICVANLVPIYLTDIKLTKTLSVNVANTPFTWIEVMNNYWLNGRVLLNGKINGNDTVFNTTNYLKQGNEVKNIPLCCDAFDPYELITTNVGTGIVSEATEDKDGKFNIKPIYQ